MLGFIGDFDLAALDAMCGGYFSIYLSFSKVFDQMGFAIIAFANKNDLALFG